NYFLAYYWVECTHNSPFPSSAVLGGSDVDGQPIYVGRAYHDGDWIPAKIVPGRRSAYLSYAGKEICVSKYQVLCEQKFDWVPSTNGQVPPNAVIGGRTSSGENLYIGRARHGNSLTVGKIHPSHHTCYISFGGQEHSKKTYEVLVQRH
ncbi:natterin-4-like, partial [Sitophilus oryzae]|uniref:Natterin-4-like n=1 Tax=Sitophilus oryzae TaxID=7048 RepID=A0A6J2YER8_SITOR